MAVIKLFPTKDATLYSAFPVQNTGLDEIIEVSTTFLPNSPEVSRFLTQFSTDEIVDFINDHVRYRVYNEETEEYEWRDRIWQTDLRAYIAEVDGLSNKNTLESYPISLPWSMGTGKYNDMPKTEDGCSWEFRSESGSNPWVDSDGVSKGARAINPQGVVYLNNETTYIPTATELKTNPSESLYKWRESLFDFYNLSGDFIYLGHTDVGIYAVNNPPLQRHVVRYSTSEAAITGDIGRLPVTSIYGKSFVGGNSFLGNSDLVYSDEDLTPYPSGTFFRQGNNIFYVEKNGTLMVSTASNAVSAARVFIPDCVGCMCHDWGSDFHGDGIHTIGDIEDDLGHSVNSWTAENAVFQFCCPAALGCICCVSVAEDNKSYFDGFTSGPVKGQIPFLTSDFLLGFTDREVPVWSNLEIARDYSLLSGGGNISSVTIGAGTGFVVSPTTSTPLYNQIDSSVYNDLNSSDVRNARNSNPFTPSSSRVQFIEVADNYKDDNPGGGTWFTGSISGLPVKADQRLNYTSDKDIKMNVTNTIKLFYSGTIDNNGFIVKQSDNDEFKASEAKAANIKYFSIDTHTIYPPHLDMKVRDFSYSIGSNSVIDTQEVVATLAQNQGEYRRGSIQKFYINCRPQFPERTFSTDSDYNKNYILPQSSYYAIKDLATNEFVIDFDTTFTQISADSKGSYFTLYMNGLEPERYYQVLIKTTINGTTLVLDDNYYFKVING
jgi:hypothetical protein